VSYPRVRLLDFPSKFLPKFATLAKDVS
jgi:hypothetical protein